MKRTLLLAVALALATSFAASADPKTEAMEAFAQCSVLNMIKLSGHTRVLTPTTVQLVGELCSKEESAMLAAMPGDWTPATKEFFVKAAKEKIVVLAQKLLLSQ